MEKQRIGNARLYFLIFNKIMDMKPARKLKENQEKMLKEMKKVARQIVKEDLKLLKELAKY